MSHEVILRFDEPLLRRAILCFWWRVIGIRFVIAMVVMAVGLVVLVSGGDRSWFVGVLATVLALGVAFVVAIYVVHYRHSLRVFRKMGDPEATLTLTESSLSMSSGAGSSTIPWSTVTELWQFPDFWLLFFSKSQFVTIPLANFTPDAKAFLLGRVEASGAKIA
jgi:YcxB-like protein